MTSEGAGGPVARAELRAVGAQPLEAEDPRRIGPFPILGVLGSGGMGRVYLGLAPNGYTAVKRVLPYLAGDQTFLRHFGQELDNQARLPAGVSARLLAADRTARPPWFATAYLPGVTLHDGVHLSGGALSAETLWALLRELAARLAAVARLDMVHRDLKPSNVMLTAEGVTLIDFGVARAADQSSVTATGVAVGTPAYMAPEQARAVKRLTPAVDVFSLGGMLAFAAGGTPPFGEGSGADMFYRIVHQDPDLDALREVDAELAEVVAGCLAKDPAERPSAAALFERATARAAAGAPLWPDAITRRIVTRRAFAEAAPVAETDVTEADETEAEAEVPGGVAGIGVVPGAAAPVAPVVELTEPEAEAELPPPGLVRVPGTGETDPTAGAEAETVPVRGEAPPNPDLVPTQRTGDASQQSQKAPKPERPRRKRRMVLILPLVLATGTAGTLVALNKVPWVGSAGRPDSANTILTTGSKGTGPTGGATATATHTAGASPSVSGKASGKPSTGTSTSAAGGSGSVGGSGSGGSSGGSGGSGSGGGGTSTKTTPASGGGKTTAAPSGPSGPGSDSSLVSGSVISVNSCEGWMDFSMPVFTGTVSAGSAANCGGSLTYSASFGSPGTPTTTDISASGGGKSSATSCGSGCWYAGAYQIHAKLCVWNKSASSHEVCTENYTYDSTTGKVT